MKPMQKEEMRREFESVVKRLGVADDEFGKYHLDEGNLYWLWGEAYCHRPHVAKEGLSIHLVDIVRDAIAANDCRIIDSANAVLEVLHPYLLQSPDIDIEKVAQRIREKLTALFPVGRNDSFADILPSTKSAWCYYAAREAIDTIFSK